MLIKIYPENPNIREVKKITEILNNGGVIIYPSDTVYAIGCDIFNNKAVEKVAKLKGVKIQKHNFSFICHDLSHISDFTKPISNHVFKLMKKNLPGPFTFILPASNNVPKLFKTSKRTVGIRIPNNNIPRKIVKELGRPILTTSLHDDDDIMEYSTDPELIYEKYENQVDAVIDGGYGGLIASTIVDCTQDVPAVIREGLGELSL